MPRKGRFLDSVDGLIRKVLGKRGGGGPRRLSGRSDARVFVNRIISDGVQLNQVPSPSESEKLRMEFVIQRLGEFGISNLLVDKAGNVAAFLPASGPRNDFLLMTAGVGDAEYATLESSVRLTEDRAFGRGFGQASLGPAALLVLAEYLQTTGFLLERNLLLLFTRSASVDEGLDAYRSFLDKWADRISVGIVVHGVDQGVIESRQIGANRFTVTVKTPERPVLSPGSGISAATLLGAMAARLGELPGAGAASASVSISRLEAGLGFGQWASEGFMEGEILSEDAQALDRLTTQVRAAIEAPGKAAGVDLDLRIHSLHAVGAPGLNAPVTEVLKTILTRLKIGHETGVLSEMVAILNEAGIPAAAAGVARGSHSLEEEYVELTSIEAGFRQLLHLVEKFAGPNPGLGDRNP